MKTYNIIVGKRSFLSKFLQENLKQSVVISLKNFNKKKFEEKYLNLKINLIINHFYPISKIHNKNSLYLIKKSVEEISSFLDFLNKFNINKIIFSSSSSVYGRKFKNLGFNRYHYGNLKYECEKIIKKFCLKKKCYFSICRIFNMYGGKDKNSVIYKILFAIKNKTKFKVINNGNTQRDFIHVKDVAEIYSKLLRINKNEIIDLGTGHAIAIKAIFNMLSSSQLDIINIKKEIKEIPISVAKKNIQTHRLKNKFFIKLETYLKNQ